MVVRFFFGGERPKEEVVRGSIDEDEDGAAYVLYCVMAVFNGGKAFSSG
jgi:hypothetical protein